MAKYKFEYIWVDGVKPTPGLRSKTKVLDMDFFHGDAKVLPMWSFDGSSTQQAEGHSSDCLLKPVNVYPDTAREHAFLVVCEVMNADGTPHATNTRALIEDDDKDFWFGFEQEYVLVDGDAPLGFPEQGYPGPQGPYYCAVGTGNVAGREVVEAHLDICLDAGLNITGINAEVLLGQWEYQVLGKGGKKGGDDLLVSRYLLFRSAEQYGLKIEFHPKPLQGDWNGSGMHVNFSNERMRNEGGKDYFTAICDQFGKRHRDHINLYGAHNEQRLTGDHETQSIEEFSYGVSDRGASIRIPVTTAQTWKGYLEDRRPASNADPYLVTGRVIKTVKEVGAKKKDATKGKAAK